MTILQTIEINLVNYLQRIGQEPVKIKAPDYWYKSPLRDEKSSSFKVNRSLNRWFDFEDGKYGNLVDFGILYHQCSVSNSLQKLDGSVNFIGQFQRKGNNFFSKGEENNRIKILSVHEVSSYSLVNYLRSRKFQIISLINIVWKSATKQEKKSTMLLVIKQFQQL